jgi:hypothetical protein
MLQQMCEKSWTLSERIDDATLCAHYHQHRENTQQDKTDASELRDTIRLR